MKKYTIAIIAAVALMSVSEIQAGTTIIAGSGINVTANTTTNLSAVATVGQLTLSPQTLTQSYGNATNAGAIKVYARLSFDGTNFYTVPTYWTNSAVGSTNGARWVMATAYYPVYGSLSISNAMGQTLTNYQAVLSN